MATRFASGLCVACPVGTDMAHSRSNLWLEAPRHRRRRRNCQSELLGRKLPGHGLLNSLELRGGALIAANSPPPRARSARRQQRTLWASLLLPTTPGCAARRCGLPAALTGGHPALSAASASACGDGDWPMPLLSPKVCCHGHCRFIRSGRRLATRCLALMLLCRRGGLQRFFLPFRGLHNNFNNTTCNGTI